MKKNYVIFFIFYFIFVIFWSAFAKDLDKRCRGPRQPLQSLMRVGRLMPRPSLHNGPPIYEKIEKIIYADGSIKFYEEIISSRNKIKFWYYTALTSIIVGLTLLAS